MSQSSPRSKGSAPQKAQTCDEQVSINDNGLLAEAVYCGDHEPPVQFAIKRPDRVTIEPHISTDTRQITPPSRASMMAKIGVVLLPSGCAPYGSQDELVRQIKSFIHRYSDIDPFWEELVAHFVLMTWVYDRFTAVPYLRFIGEPGTGKSRMLQVAGHLAYKGIFAGGATTSSPLFRLIEVYRGTVVIDEADYKTSAAWVEIIKILNSGYMKGAPVLRSEKVGDAYEPTPYDVFGPKIIGNRFPFDDWALETRCITLEMEEQSLRSDIPRQLPAKFYSEALELRNMLLQWRFDNLQHVESNESELLHLEPRLTQIATPLYSISSNREFRSTLVEFLNEYGRKQEGEKPQATVVQALANLVAGNQTETLLVQNVAAEVNRIRAGMGEEMTARRVGGLLRSMRIKPKKTREGYRFTLQREGLEALLAKYPSQDDPEHSVEAVAEAASAVAVN